MSVKDVGDGLEGELRSWDANEFGNDNSDGGEHGLTAVFELGFTSNYAVLKDAQIKFKREECTIRMGKSVNYAVKKDAQIKFRKEECAPSMGQSYE